MRVVDVVEKSFYEILDENKWNYELVDIEFVKEGPDRFLRLYVDKINPKEKITIEDLEKITKVLNKKLDILDPVEENYYLEVSSCGIERPLKKIADFEKFRGKLVQIKLYSPVNSKKLINGFIKNVKKELIFIEEENDKSIFEINFNKIANAKLLFKFD